MSNNERNPLIGHSSEPSDSMLRRSWHAMADIISPFSKNALALLPQRAVDSNTYSTRADAIPEQRRYRNYQSVNIDLPPGVRIPKKISTPIKVEAKVWFANERTWVAYTNLGVLLGTLSIALFTASKDPIARNFGYAYAAISCGIIVYGYAIYQKRITMIRKRVSGSFDEMWGPVVIAGLLFIAVLANFGIRWNEISKGLNNSRKT